MTDRFSNALGEVLRRARKQRGMTLDDVRRRSRGRFKSSAVGGYERGERAISLERFCDLSEMYGVPPTNCSSRFALSSCRRGVERS
ncbi:MAG: helix-turn-helix domain-containing protein [Actinomycetota bacterium]